MSTSAADERIGIEQAVRTYFDGLYEGNTEKLGSVFHETAALTWEQDGHIAIWTRAQWFEAVAGRPSPQARGLARDDAILQVDQSGPTTAFVKVRCQMPPRYFTDYLSLLKLDGRWQVVQKVFSTVTRS